MKISSLLLSSCLLLGAVTGVATAQPDQNAGAPAENPPNREVKPQTPEEKEAAQKKQMEDAMKQGQEKAMEMMKMTPEERAAALHKIMEQAFRMQLTASGIKDLKTQDALVQFIALQEEQRAEVRRTGAKLFKAMNAGVGDQELNIMLSDYLGAVEDAKAEREKDCQDLDDAIGYSTNPKLAALLNLFGMVGDASFYTADINMMSSIVMAGLSGAFTTAAPKKEVLAAAPN